MTRAIRRSVCYIPIGDYYFFFLQNTLYFTLHVFQQRSGDFILSSIYEKINSKKYEKTITKNRTKIKQTRVLTENENRSVSVAAER